MMYTIYEVATGKIVSVGTYRPERIQAYLDEGQAAYEGEVDTNVFDRIVDGEPVSTVKTFDAQAHARAMRNVVLQSSDWTQGADSPLSDDAKAAWRTYRQQLRDFPTMVGECTCQQDVEDLMPLKPGNANA